MKNIKAIIAISVVLAICGCKENSTDIKEDNIPRLVLTADKTSGQSPLTVNFTGNFLGEIDTIKMLVPDHILYPGTGKTIIRYALSDTTQPAKQVYTETVTYNGTGTVKAVMLLQSKYKDYFSDTLSITID